MKGLAKSASKICGVGCFALVATASLARSQTFTNGDWTYTLNASNEATVTGYRGPGGAVIIPSALNGAAVRQLSGGSPFGSSIFGYKNSNVTNVVIPNTVTNIAPDSFLYCSAIRTVSIPESVKFIGGNAFNGCISLASVTIPGSVTNIDNGAFVHCSGLTNVALGHGVQRIGYNTFAGCSNLVSVTIPASVTNVFISAFGGSGIKRALFLGNPPAVSGDAFPSSAVINYLQGTPGWSPPPPPFQSTQMTAVFTQDEYDANRTSGRGDVTNNPSGYNLFTLTQYNANRTNGRADVTGNPAAYSLFTQTQYEANRTNGRLDVLADPASYSLYTPTSIMDLRMGGVMVQKQGDNAVVTFQPQTTTDLTQPFTNNGAPITNQIPMPGNKGFIRIRANQ